MTLRLRNTAWPLALLLGWAMLGSAAYAVDPSVVDNAKLFSTETIRKANEALAEIKKSTKKTVVIETYQGVPADKRAAFRADRAKFYDNWVEARGKALGIHGSLFLVCIETQDDVGPGGKPGKRIEVYTDPDTKKQFTKEEANAAVQKLGKSLSGDANQGLLDMVALTKTSMGNFFADNQGLGKTVEQQVKNNNSTPVVAPKKPDAGDKEGMMGMGTILLYIVGGLLAFWILIGLVRAFTRPRVDPAAYGTPPPPPGMGNSYNRGGMAPPPPPGYGQPYGQPYGGQPMGYPPQQAGGMGFMGSLMTGMLGAAAGNFMYDRFFRGGSSHYGNDYGSSGANTGGGYFGGGSSSNAPPATGYTTGADFPGDDAPAGNDDQDIANADTNFGGGGGSVGGDFASNDTGGGADYDNGGDFGGGGGDFGGGGDSGGGGGDSGGGDF